MSANNCSLCGGYKIWAPLAGEPKWCNCPGIERLREGFAELSDPTSDRGRQMAAVIDAPMPSLLVWAHGLNRQLMITRRAGR